jgi:Calcineurin-like phosphoesterase
MLVSSAGVADEQRTYAIGDVHGHRAELEGALRTAGLLDESGDWAGDQAHLWFLGDFVDRGPDGVGVIDLVMRLHRQAADAGGMADTLLGNHEILMLGMYKYGDTDVPSDFGPRSFARSWEINGGQLADQQALTEAHVDWLTSRKVLTVAADRLLMHSDTIEYLQWGETVEQINDSVTQLLKSDDLGEWWECWRRMTTRYSFRGPQGQEVAEQLLGFLGGDQIVHGHSVIADQLGILPAQVEAPYEYAGGKVLGIDGGLFVGGPCLIVSLPHKPDD